MHALAALSWDPEIRGAVVLGTAILILCGSVYLLLATNLGARLGFLVAVAGLTGWLTVLALVWAVYGKGDTGPEPTWKVQTVVSGTLGQTARPPLDRFPGGWKQLASDSPARGEAEAVVDAELTKGPSAQTLGFSSTSDYVPLAGYEKGGQNYEFFRHRPHYAVIEVQGAVAQQAKAGAAPPKPEADTTKPVVTILLIRDLGSLRLPSAVISFASFIIFAVTIYVLHRRDKIAMAARAG
jgi:hypothetical protein